MMYMSITLDPYKKKLDIYDIIILVLSELTILSGFATVWDISFNCAIVCIIFGSLCICGALFLLLLRSYDTYSHSLRLDKETSDLKQVVNNTKNRKLALRMLHSAIYLLICLPVFPIVFVCGYLKFFKVKDVYACVSIMNFLSKHCFALVLTDFQLEKMDPNVVALNVEKSANEARRAFLRYVFHEVRVPLNSISMGLHVLETHEFDEECIETIDMMQEATHFMAETLNDVLSIQKIEEGKFEIELAECEVKSIVNNASLTLRGQMYLKGIDLSINVESDVPNFIIADRFRLEHVLASMVSNALKFSKENGKIRIHISIQDTSNFSEALPDYIDVKNAKEYCIINFSVFDEGCGINEEDQAELFLAYSNVGNSGSQRRSAGIGLTICKEIIGKHHGVIGVNSDPTVKVGSEFYFSVPVKVVQKTNIVSTSSEKSSESNLKEDVKIEKISSSSSAAAIEVDNSKQNDSIEDKMNTIKNSKDVNKTTTTTTTTTTMNSIAEQQVKKSQTTSESSDKIDSQFNVLVVDDVASNRKLLTILLKKLNKGTLNVENAACGEEGIQAVVDNPGKYDIIFMDNIMPDMTGLEVSKTLRSTHKYENLLIGVTGNVMDDDLKEFVEAGADIALPKPVQISLLKKIISHCITHGTGSIRHDRNASNGDSEVLKSMNNIAYFD